MTTQTNTDWAEGAQIVKEHTPPGTVVLFEFMNPFPRYQPLFYGQPRYLENSYPVRYARTVVTAGHELNGEPIAVLLAGGARTSVAPVGWRVIDDGHWRLLLPPDDVSGDATAVLAMLDESIADDRLDVAIRLSYAIELARDGAFDRALSVLNRITPPDVPDPQLRFRQYWDAARAQILELQDAA